MKGNCMIQYDDCFGCKYTVGTLIFMANKKGADVAIGVVEDLTSEGVHLRLVWVNGNVVYSRDSESIVLKEGVHGVAMKATLEDVLTNKGC